MGYTITEPNEIATTIYPYMKYTHISGPAGLGYLYTPTLRPRRLSGSAGLGLAYKGD